MVSVIANSNGVLVEHREDVGVVAEWNPAILKAKPPRFILFYFIIIIAICLRGELKRNKAGAERGELVTLLDEPYLALLFNCLPTPPSAPAVGRCLLS
jgi:hypothetical protein